MESKICEPYRDELGVIRATLHAKIDEYTQVSGYYFLSTFNSLALKNGESHTDSLGKNRDKTPTVFKFLRINALSALSI